MMTILGHASASEKHRIEELEIKLLDRSITGEEQLELALLYIEPCHEGFRAADLLRQMSVVGSQIDLAKLWLAYCCIYNLMDNEALREAVHLCDELLEQGVSARLQAAALFLRAASLRQLAPGYDPVRELCESVRLEPTWIANRQLLAQIYEERGNRLAAKEQLREAIEASRSQLEPLSYADRLFEMLITARGAYRITQRLQDQLRQLMERAPP